MAYALITGASKGIGKAIAFELAEKGYDLILCARSGELLESIGKELSVRFKVKVNCYALDLSQEEHTEQLIALVHKENTPLEILINNAGYGLWGRFDKLTLQEQLNLIEVNIRVMVKLTHSLLPLLKKQKRAYVLNVASTAAYQAVPTLAVYSASKAFVLRFTRALRIELKDGPVSVSCISPGPTDTNFMNAAGMHSVEMQKRAAKFNMTPEKVAKIAVKGLFAGKKEIIPGLLNSLSVWMVDFTPKAITEKIAEGLYK